MNELRKQIEARKQEARDKRIGERAEFIAKTLPEVSAARPVLWSYRDDDFNILAAAVSACGPDKIVSTFVDYKGTPVFFAEGDDIYRYIPGPWEEGLAVLYSQAVAAVAAKSKLLEDQEAAALVEEAKKFGL